MNADPTAATLDVYTSRQVKTLDDKELQEILLWIDKIPLSREKRNLTRDMSDGVPIAELVKHFLPKLVELHQYTPSNGTQAKEKNWFHLNRRVFSKLGFELHADVVHGLSQCKPWFIENVLIALRQRIEDQIYSDGTWSGTGTGTGTGPAMMTSRTGANTDRTAVGGQSPVALKRSDMIQKSVVEQQRKQILEQNKTIDVLTANILKLEHIVHLKDIRIDDLSARLEKAGLQVPRDPASLTDRRPMPGSTDRTKLKPAQSHGNLTARK